jgi:phosphoglucosamine mutase
MKYFGTDGIRAQVNNSFLNQNFALNLGEAVGAFVKKNNPSNRNILIGRDTRSSGEMLLQAFAQGLNNLGCTGTSIGIVPTPALAYSVTSKKSGLGVMITASHNQEHDNGFKFFSQLGTKLSDADEVAIEKMISMNDKPIVYQPVNVTHVIDSYSNYILSLFPNNLLNGMKIVVDLSYGATMNTTPNILSKLGAEVVILNKEGGKINDHVGSEFPHMMAEKTIHEGADFGIAHDGDGDRAIFCDSMGKIVHGDILLGLLAIHEHSQNRLKSNTFIATIHSNSGLEASLRRHKISVSLSEVGDKRVAELMKKKNSNFGGESSGHLVASDFLPTGDGLITALLIARVMVESNRPLNKLCEQITLWPSFEGSFLVNKKIPIDMCHPLKTELDLIRNDLGEQGRILLRYSGTEPKIRLLVESINKSKAHSAYNSLAKTIKKTL